MPQQFLECDYVCTHFQQVGSIAMPEAMGGHMFFDPAQPSGFPGGPLHASCCHGGIFTGAAFPIEQPLYGPFGIQVGADATDEQIA